MKEILIFEWVVVDNCNLKCDYCVNKGEFSHKDGEKLLYVSGREVDIAQKIVDLSSLAYTVVVNLTGGEPLLASRIKEVISILKTGKNIRINLISNFALIDRILDNLKDLNSILVSLHIHYRSEENIERLIAAINKAKQKTKISISQVDYNLSDAERKMLSHISSSTGQSISMQPFIPPWTDKGKVNNDREISDATFISSLGKRCSLGYFYYLLLPDGTFYYGLWCNKNSRKTGNFLASSVKEEVFSATEMKKCPDSSCGCNYNLSFYEEYAAECRKLGCSQKEIFGRYNKIVDYTIANTILRFPRVLFKRVRYILACLKRK